MSKNGAKQKATDRWGLSTVGGNARMARTGAFVVTGPEISDCLEFHRKCSASTNTPPVRPTYGESLASCAAPALLTPAAERAYFTYVRFTTLYYYGFIEGHPMPMGRARVRGGRCELRVITYYTLHGIVRVLHTLANIGDSAKNRWNSVHVRHELYAVSIPGKRGPHVRCSLLVSGRPRGCALQ